MLMKCARKSDKEDMEADLFVIAATFKEDIEDHERFHEERQTNAIAQLRNEVEDGYKNV